MSMRANASRLFIGLLFLSGCATATSATSQAVSAAAVEVTFRIGKQVLHGFEYKSDGNGPFRGGALESWGRAPVELAAPIGTPFCGTRLRPFHSPSKRARPFASG